MRRTYTGSGGRSGEAPRHRFCVVFLILDPVVEVVQDPNRLPTSLVSTSDEQREVHAGLILVGGGKLCQKVAL